MKIKVSFLTTRDDKKNPQIGDCIVITFDEKFAEGDRKACIVIDGGYTSSKFALKKYLEDNGIKIIDLMVATHIDNDHIAGLKAFLRDYVKKKKGKKNKFELRNYWGPAPKTFVPISITEFVSYIEDVDDLGIDEISFISQSVKENEKLFDLVKGILDDDRIFHPSVRIRDYVPEIFSRVAIDILAPDKQVPDDEIKGKRLEEVSLGNELVFGSEIDLKSAVLKDKVNAAAIENNRTANNQSIVLKLTPLDDNGKKIKSCTFLFTGDAEDESWEYMIPRWGRELEAKILKVSHHGSRTGTNQNVLKKVKPKYCIICAGKNTHGLPDDDILKMIDEKGLKIFCTGRNPNVSESPCIGNKILKKCSRWDYASKKHIKDTIVFEVDTTAPAIAHSGNPCGFNWRNIH